MNKSINLSEILDEAMSAFAGENYAQSIRLLTEVLAHDPRHGLAMSARGAAFFKMNNLNAALADFNRTIELSPGHARAYHLRGLVREKLADDRGALSDFNSALALDPEYGAAYYSRANLYGKMGRSEDASEDMQMVTMLSARNTESLVGSANVWRTHHMRVEEMMETELNR